MYLARRKPPIQLDDVIEDFKKGPERICELLELLCGIKIDMQGGKLPGQENGFFSTAVKNYSSRSNYWTLC